MGEIRGVKLYSCILLLSSHVREDAEATIEEARGLLVPIVFVEETNLGDLWDGLQAEFVSYPKILHY